MPVALKQPPPKVTPPKSLLMLVVYRGGEDYPRGFSIRKYLISPCEIVDCGSAGIADTLFQVRKLIPASLYRVERDAGDDPRIVETYV